MDHESIEFKIVIHNGQDTEVLARLAAPDLAGPAYMADHQVSEPAGCAAHAGDTSSSRLSRCHRQIERARHRRVKVEKTLPSTRA
jgi:hypothetical protein